MVTKKDCKHLQVKPCRCPSKVKIKECLIHGKKFDCQGCLDYSAIEVHEPRE